MYGAYGQCAVQNSTEFNALLIGSYMVTVKSAVLLKQPRYGCAVTLDGKGLLLLDDEDELLEDEDDELLLDDDDEEYGAV